METSNEVESPHNKGTNTDSNHSGGEDSSRMELVRSIGDSGITNIVNPEITLVTGFMELVEPPIQRARAQLKELIGRQNKLYVELSHQKYIFDSTECSQINAMMQNVNLYRGKLLKLRKQLKKAFYRSDALKTRVSKILAAKQKEQMRNRLCVLQEETLIANQQTDERSGNKERDSS